MPWQKDWINEIYACDAKGNLRYRWSLLGIPKKNGKCTMIAAVALYHLIVGPDEADPWAVCAAASDRQAAIVFNAAKLMCELPSVPGEATDRYAGRSAQEDGRDVSSASPLPRASSTARTSASSWLMSSTSGTSRTGRS